MPCQRTRFQLAYWMPGCENASRSLSHKHLRKRVHDDKRHRPCPDWRYCHHNLAHQQQYNYHKGLRWLQSGLQHCLREWLHPEANHHRLSGGRPYSTIDYHPRRPRLHLAHYFRPCSSENLQPPEPHRCRYIGLLRHQSVPRFAG